MLTDLDFEAEKTGGFPYDGVTPELLTPLPVDPTLAVVFLDIDGFSVIAFWGYAEELPNVRKQLRQAD